MTSSLDTGLTQSASVYGTAEQELALVIAWVFPEPKLTILASGPLTLGRSGEADIHLPGRQTSRLHARLLHTRHAWVLRDENSKNGVQVNGQPVDEAPLSEQDVVRVGEWIGVLTRATEEQIQRGTPTVEQDAQSVGGAAICQALQTIERAARSDLSVMLVGETGAGKEVFARTLHRLSERPGEFIATNCATIPEQMAEAELFGYGRGAFTGAAKSSRGHFRSAHDGTLFLDEIPDLAATIQVKMLRALEERAVVPLGQSHPEPANARLVCAAQKPLHDYVERGVFRADLYSRLNGVEVLIPPLRKRREEVLTHFLRSLGATRSWRLSPEAAEQLCLYDWPLNVREVVQAARRTLALHGEVERIQLEHLPGRIATFAQTGEALRPSVVPPSRPAENATDEHPRDRLARRLAEALRHAGGNVSVAAKSLGLSRPMAYRLMKRLPDLDPEEIRLATFEN